MKIAPLADVKAKLSAYLDECSSDGPIVITRNGKPAAVLLVPFDEDDLERLSLHSRPIPGNAQSVPQEHSVRQGTVEADFWKSVDRDLARQRPAPRIASSRNVLWHRP